MVTKADLMEPQDKFHRAGAGGQAERGRRGRRPLHAQPGVDPRGQLRVPTLLRGRTLEVRGWVGAAHRRRDGYQAGRDGYQAGRDGYQAGRDGYQAGREGYQAGREGRCTGGVGES